MHHAMKVERAMKEASSLGIYQSSALYRTFRIHIFLGILTIVGSIGIYISTLILELLVGFIFTLDSTMNILLSVCLCHIFCTYLVFLCLFTYFFFRTNLKKNQPTPRTFFWVERKKNSCVCVLSLFSMH